MCMPWRFFPRATSAKAVFWQCGKGNRRHDRPDTSDFLSIRHMMSDHGRKSPFRGPINSSWIYFTRFASHTRKVVASWKRIAVLSLARSWPLSSWTSSRIMPRKWSLQWGALQQLRTRMKKWIESPRNFKRLLLGCIDTDFASESSLENSWRDLQD